MDWPAIISALFFALGCAPLAFFQVACPCCVAVACGTGCSSTPVTISVTLTGYGNNSCSTCADYNTTYVLTRGSGTCRYEVFPNMSCDAAGNDWIQATLSLTGGQTRIVVEAQINGTVGHVDDSDIFWQKDIAAGPIACKDYGTFAAPFLLASGAGLRCTHDSSDATVTLA
jgi:hypothetical protein